MTGKQIIEQIIQEKYNYTHTNGSQPNVVVLSKNLYKEIKDYAFGTLGDKYSPNVCGLRMVEDRNSENKMAVAKMEEKDE